MAVNSTNFKVASRKFSSQSSITKIDFTHDEKKMPSERLHAHCKILSVSCKTVEHFVTILKDKEFSSAINLSAQCFVIIAEVNRLGMSDIESVADNFPEEDYIDRPLIIQVGTKSLDMSTIFFKDRRELKTVKLPKRPLEIKKFVDESLDLNLLLQMLSSNVGGGIDGEDVLSCEFNEIEVSGNLNFLKWAVESDESLSLRFLKLFFKEDDIEPLLEKAVKKSSLATIVALLDLPVNFNKNGQKALPYLDNHLVATLTSAAIAEARIEVLQLLLALVSDDCKKLLKDASEFAYKIKNWKLLEVLLKNDAPFPTKITEIFDAMDDESKAVRCLCLERKSFCDAIKNNDRETVEKFIDDNPAIKIGFNFSNHSSLAVALKAGKKSQKFEMYALLQYHQFTAPNDDVHKNFFNNLFPVEKQTITIARHKFYGSAFDSHVFFIYSKSRLGFKYPRDQETRYFEKIKEFLLLLSQIEGVNPILAVIEHSDALTVTFDFEATAVNKLDMLSGPSTLGICYSQSGRIYIGAKGFTNEVVATLAHELCHYAMQILFNNDCKPYSAGDHQNRQAFRSTVREYEEINDHVPIIGSVFDCYEEQHYDSELIVRVPQIMAHCRENPKQLKRYAEKYEKLFEFYEKRILKVIEKFINTPEEFHHVRRVQQLNEKLGNFEDGWFDTSNRKSSKLIDESSLESQHLLLNSNVPEITESSVLQSFLKAKSPAEITGTVLMTSLKNFENEYFRGNFYELANASLTVVIRFESNEDMTSSQAWKFIRESIQTRFVMICDETNHENVKPLLNSLNYNELNVHHEWNDLSDKSKFEIFNNEVSFQNSLVKLNQLVENDSQSLQHLPVEEFFKRQTPVICKHVEGSKGYDRSFYVERTFYEALDTDLIGKLFQQNIEMESYCQKNNWPMYRPTDTQAILSFSENNQHVVVSDYAGKGKSTLLSHLVTIFKENQKELLVVRLNFNEYGETLKNAKSGTEFIIKQVLKPKNLFEEALFEELLRKGKAFVMLDGFDEIVPFYEKECLDVLKSLINASKAKIWISTRPHLCETLEKLFNVHSIYLLPFTESDQINFMVRFWKNALNTNEDAQLEHCAKEVIAKMKDSLDSSQMGIIGIPLQTRMIAEIFQKDVREFLASDDETASFVIPNQFNMLTMYKTFISCKIQIVQSEKGKLVGEEKADLEAEGVSVLGIHEKLALNEIFDKTNECDMEKDQLQRYGLITFVGDNPKFVHRTFSEYLVTNFIIKNFKRLDEQILYGIIFNSYKYHMVLNFLEIELKSSDLFTSDQELMKKLAAFIGLKMPLVIPGNGLLIQRCVYRHSETMALFFLQCMRYASDDMPTSFYAAGMHKLLMLASSCRSQSGIRHIIQDIVEGQIIPVSRLLLEKDSYHFNAFQSAFLTDLSNQSLQTFYEIYKKYFSDHSSLRNLFFERTESCLKEPVEFVLYPVESIENICDLRLKIAREFTGMSDDELVNGDHLFSIFFKQIQLENQLKDEFLEWSKSRNLSHHYSGKSRIIRPPQEDKINNIQASFLVRNNFLTGPESTFLRSFFKITDFDSDSGSGN